MSAFSVSEPFPIFHDRDGQPLDAGYLYFGTAGLPAVANQIPVYVDALLTIPVAQPVRTLNGFPQHQGAACRLFVNADDFSVAVHQSDNTLVLSSLNATVRIPFAVMTGAITTDQVTYVEGSVGATTRILTSKLQESVSVFDFMTAAQIADVRAGALLIDVTAAINAAIVSSDDVYFPEGSYRVTNDGTPTSGAIQIPNGTEGKTLRGAGRSVAIIRNFGLGPCITSIGNVLLFNLSVRICDMTIQGGVGSGDGIFCDFTSHSMFERLQILQCDVSGMKIQRGSHNSFTDVWSRANTFDGLFIGKETFFTTITGGTFESNNRFGLNVDANGGIAPNDVTVSGASFRTNGQHNVSVLDGASGVRLFGCHFTTSPTFTTTQHLSVNGGVSVSRACLASGCSFTGQNNLSTVVGAFGNACESLTLDGCIVDCTGSTAFELTATAALTRIVNCAAIIGTRIDASSSTTELLPDGGVYALRRSSTFAAPTIFGFGAGQAIFDTTLIPAAFAFYALNAVAIFPVLRLDSFRLWIDPLSGFLYVNNGADPTFTNDGLIVNANAPVPSYVRGALPGGGAGTVGTTIRGFGFAAAAAWGAASGAIPAGANSYLFSWDPVFSDWRVFAIA